MQQGEEEDIPIPLPFPREQIRSRSCEIKHKRRIYLRHSRRVEINIPLLDAVKQIPKYAKFRKSCAPTRGGKGNERVSLNRMSQDSSKPTMPRKCKDPGTFSIPCLIGNYRFDDCMLDLGASINVMPRICL
ncbi:hypothetical protein K1719_017931 [Acacia pycnantha]|nr:hypothetical protein K1719_017931 [Acacia pycnantha]